MALSSRLLCHSKVLFPFINPTNTQPTKKQIQIEREEEEEEEEEEEKEEKKI